MKVKEVTTMNKLYENIKNRRKELRMTQSDLAKALGYADRSIISRIEAGEIDLGQSKIIQIANALDTTPGDLMGDTGYRATLVRTRYPDLHLAIETLDPNDAELVANIIRRLRAYEDNLK